MAKPKKKTGGGWRSVKLPSGKRVQVKVVKRGSK